MFITPWESLAPWVLLLPQESYLLYIDAKICKNQSAAIENRTILHIFSSIWDLIDVSKQSCFNIFEFLWTFYRIDWDFMPFVSLFWHKFVIRKFILPFLSLVMKTNSFTRLKLHTPISNLKLKKWFTIGNFYSYMRSLPGVSTPILLYIIVAEAPAFLLILIQGLKKCKYETMKWNNKYCW